MSVGVMISNILSLCTEFLSDLPDQEIEAELKKLKSMLERIKAMVYDAKQREMIRDLSVLLWLKELVKVAYNAHKVLNEYHHVLLQKSDSRKRKLIEVTDGTLNQIQQISSRIDKIVNDGIALQLSEGDGPERCNDKLQIAEITHFKDQSYIFGQKTVNKCRMLPVVLKSNDLLWDELLEELNELIHSVILDMLFPSLEKRDAWLPTTETMRTVSPNKKVKRRINSWNRGKQLGGGSFGTVYEAISDEGFFFAVKEVLIDEGNHAQQCISQLEQEISLLSQFEHENIVQYYGTDMEETKLNIFLELMTQGTIRSLYQKYPLQDKLVSEYTRQILYGLVYLHERNIVHRDIKCANVLVHANGSVKIADFGLAKMITRNNILSCKGSVYWMAPEVAHPKKAYKAYGLESYGLEADIWSLGCTVLEMFTHKIPYPDLEWQQAFFKIGRGEQPPIPNYLSIEAQDFIKQCVRVNPAERPSAVQLLEHPFVKIPPASQS